MRSSSLLLFVVLTSCICATTVRADSFLPQIGGKGGAQYSERCPQGQILNGFEVRAGDDIDAIRAVCVAASSPTEVGEPPLTNGFGGGWHGGGGGSLRRLLCPPGTPVVVGLVAGFDGIDTISLDTIDIYCGQISKNASIGQYPSNIVHAPVQNCTHGPNLVMPTWNLSKELVFGDGRCPNFEVAGNRCPAGEIAIGMHGHSGALVDAMGLICGTAPTFQAIPSAMGHTDSKPKLTALQKAVKGAKLERSPHSVASASLLTGGSKVALNPQPLSPGRNFKNANDKAIIIVGGKANTTLKAAGHPVRSPGIVNDRSVMPSVQDQPNGGSGADWLFAVDGRGQLLRFKHQAILSDAHAERGRWNDAGFLFATEQAGDNLTVYGLQPNGDLVSLQVGGADGQRDLVPIKVKPTAQLVGHGWSSLKNKFSMGAGIVYGVEPNGDLVWHQQKNTGDTSAAPQWQTRVVGVGWDGFTRLFSTGRGVIYAIKPDGTLLWYKHNGYRTGAGLDQPGAWEGPKKVGTGWQGFKQVFAADNGHIYAVNAAGELFYYKHKGWRTGDFAWDAPVKLADGWNAYKHAFAVTGG